MLSRGQNLELPGRQTPGHASGGVGWEATVGISILYLGLGQWKWAKRTGRQPALIALCFLMVAALRCVSTSSRCLNVPTRMDFIIDLWTRTNVFSFMLLIPAYFITETEKSTKTIADPRPWRSYLALAVNHSRLRSPTRELECSCLGVDAYRVTLQKASCLLLLNCRNLPPDWHFHFENVGFIKISLNQN